ncbi:hypothetical protein K505DRAFT_63134 [Melanomma pulvis-pyrius CBS 109.77]|uniref:Uncharacterized protein n=1 Tax=Melanomma pulvis-pyrius CBS 109.77 TaxID=1314802 RepID=A0A6A6X6F9_9PLEO|nr:hypothetical protein K505DRAFT_63134 [Melanomma pulvis-pyrius CBS 109.77]
MTSNIKHANKRNCILKTSLPTAQFSPTLIQTYLHEFNSTSPSYACLRPSNKPMHPKLSRPQRWTPLQKKKQGKSKSKESKTKPPPPPPPPPLTNENPQALNPTLSPPPKHANSRNRTTKTNA